jgi:hypothetical protein
MCEQAVILGHLLRPLNWKLSSPENHENHADRTTREGLSESKHCLESLVLLESDGNSFLPSSYFSLGDFEVLKYY